MTYTAAIHQGALLTCYLSIYNKFYILSLQDNTNIDAAITCLVKNIMSVEEERALSDAATANATKTEAEGSVLVLPHFDYNRKEKGLGGCSGCSSLRARDGD